MDRISCRNALFKLNNTMPDDQENAKMQLEALGAQFAILLELADIPDDQKEAWLAILPDMSFEQIDKLMKYLVANVPEEAIEEFKVLEEKFEGIQQEYEHEVKSAQSDALDQLEVLSKKIEAEK